MSYTHTEEVEYEVNGEEVSVTLACEVNCTSLGCPETGPSMSGPGEPGEGPTFESEVAYIIFNGTTRSLKMEAAHLNQIFSEKFMNDFYERAEQKASENWEEDEPDYPDREDDDAI